MACEEENCGGWAECEDCFLFCDGQCRCEEEEGECHNCKEHGFSEC